MGRRRHYGLVPLILIFVIGAASTVYSVSFTAGKPQQSKSTGNDLYTSSWGSTAKHHAVSTMPVRGQSGKTVNQTTNEAGFQSMGCSSTEKTPCGNLAYYGGPVMHSPADYLIFWLPSGYSFDNPSIDPSASNPSDASYEQLLIRYFDDVCTPNAFYPIIHQYSDRIGGIGNCSLGGHWLDNSSYPGGRGSQSNPLTDSDIQNEVNRALATNSWGPNNGNSLFLVYTAYNVYSCSSSASCSFSQFCAYHGYFFSGSGVVVYANMPDVATSCGVGTSPNNDPFADSEINTSSHEQFESFTDPTIGAWYYLDSSHEIGDECNFVFGSNGATLLVGADSYVIQDEWSNDLSGCTLFECGSTNLPTLAADVLGCNGIGPTNIGLRWGASGYGAFFNRYEVQEEAPLSNSPWLTIATITDRSATSYYIDNLSPSVIYQWRIIDYSCCLASATSNTIEVSQPPRSALSYVQLSSTSYQFAWRNDANYTGPVAFNSYALMESVNQNPYTIAANLTSPSATNVTVSPLSSSDDSSFYLTTTDMCGGCVAGGLSRSNSNVVSIGGAPSFVGGLFGEYWNTSFFGASLSGCATYSLPVTPSLPPTKTTTDSQLNFGTTTAWNWHPLGTGNEFSVKWMGGIMISTNGTYSFQLASDDGSWLYLDSSLVINHGGQHAFSDSLGAASVTLLQGLHQIEVDYYETCGPPSGITLSWTPPGTQGSVLVPSNVLVAPPRIDTQGVYSGSCLSSRSCQLLSTNNAPDIIVLIANCEGSCVGITPTVGDSSGLVFAQRLAYCYSGSLFSSCLWEYYAVANRILSNDNISSLPNQSVRWRMITLAVSGADTNSIFDPLLPAEQHCSELNGSPADCTVSLSTSNAAASAPYEFLLVTSALNDAGQCQSPNSQDWSQPLFYDGNQETDYQLARLTQNNYSFTCTANGDPTVIVADGIQGRAPDFAIGANPSKIMATAGTVANSTIALTSLDGFAGWASLSISSIPSGPNCSAPPITLAMESIGFSSLSCTGMVGLYNVTVTALSRGRTHSSTLVFQFMDFSLNATPASLTMPIGSNSTSTISLTSLESYSGNITLTPSVSNATVFAVTGGGGGTRPLEMAPLSCELTVGLSSSNLFLPKNTTSETTLNIAASPCVSPGVYSVIVSASAFGLVHTAHVTVTVVGSNPSKPIGSNASTSTNGGSTAPILQSRSRFPILSVASLVIGIFGLFVLSSVRLNRPSSRERKLATRKDAHRGSTDLARDSVISTLMRHY